MFGRDSCIVLQQHVFGRVEVDAVLFHSGANALHQGSEALRPRINVEIKRLRAGIALENVSSGLHKVVRVVQ